MDIRVIATGGTLDKIYDPISGSLGFGQSCLAGLLADARIEPVPSIEILAQIDSLEMTDSHRDAILRAARAAPEPAIVIIHGTDTMTDTARVLAAAMLPACIILTGAMVPARVAGSDAPFNIGGAIAFAQVLPAGVWIAIAGRAHRWDAVRKNRALGRFEAVPHP